MLLSTKASAGTAEEHLTPTTKLQRKCSLLCWWHPAVFTYEARENRTVTLWAHLKNRKSDDLKLPSWLRPDWGDCLVLYSSGTDQRIMISGGSSLQPLVCILGWPLTWICPLTLIEKVSSFNLGHECNTTKIRSDWLWRSSSSICPSSSSDSGGLHNSVRTLKLFQNAPAREITWLLCWLLFIGCP